MWEEGPWTDQEVWWGSGLGTARSRPGSLFDLPDFLQVAAVGFLHLLGDIFRRGVRCSEFAFYMTNSFSMETRAHVSVLELCSIFNTFPLEFVLFSFILNSGTCSLFSTGPGVFFPPLLLLLLFPDLRLPPPFLGLIPFGLFVFDVIVSTPAGFLLSSTWEMHAGRDLMLNLWRRTSLCKSLKLTRRLFTSSLSKDCLHSWRKKWNQESTTFSNFPGKHLSWAISSL
jgi:hypothetical protein